MNKKVTSLFLMSIISSSFYAQNQKVGINTKEPRATLHVSKSDTGKDGNMIIRDTPTASSTDRALVWDSTTGKVGVSDELEKSFYVVRFTVECTDAEDFVKNFDTKIPVDKYKVFIVNLEPLQTKEPTWLDIRHINNNDDVRDWYVNRNSWIKVNAVRKSYMFEEDGTWRMYVDYPNARPSTYGSGYRGNITWDVSLLAIRKDEIREVGEQKGRVKPNIDNAPVADFPNPL